MECFYVKLMEIKKRYRDYLQYSNMSLHFLLRAVYRIRILKANVRNILSSIKILYEGTLIIPLSGFIFYVFLWYFYVATN